MEQLNDHRREPSSEIVDPIEVTNAIGECVVDDLIDRRSFVEALYVTTEAAAAVDHVVDVACLP
jgi:hypothetical protein